MLKNIVSVISAAIILFLNLLGISVKKSNDVSFKINAAALNGEITNEVSNLNIWSPQAIDENIAVNSLAEIDFVEYVQLMSATGGNAERDTFVDPLDRTVLDDYDFSSVISACRGVLKLGAKPLIKTGAVPLKFCQNPIIGDFGVNVCPPDDYNAYYTYICDFSKALINEFGLDEVRQWRFGVLTEFENSSWFYAGDKDPQKSFEEYCKLYDYTVQALIDTVGEDVVVGAHAMAVTEGLWDERLFIEHCAQGINACTGKQGTRICYLSASFYDISPGEFTDGFTPAQTIEHLRTAAERVGLDNLFYGFDEGRILRGVSSGKVDRQLNIRIVGDTWQAAYDARLLKALADSSADYFSSWGYLSGGAFSGYPSVSYHVANEFSRFAGSKRVSVEQRQSILFGKGVEAQAVAGFDGSALRIMAYNFKNDLDYKGSVDMCFEINTPQFAGKTVTVKKSVISDECNYFDEWRADREKHNITDESFYWSPDDPTLDSTTTLQAQWARDIYFSQLREKYIACSALTPENITITVGADGVINLRETLGGSNVVFYEITAVN